MTTLIEMMAKAIDQSDEAVGGERHMEYWHDLARAALAAIEAAGYRVVPVQPTPDMLFELYDRANTTKAYADMLAAAPKVTE
jgi:hypothetical protein